MELPTVVCKVVGHEWVDRQCSRCNSYLNIQVFMNGILIEQNRDYAVVGKAVSFVEAPRVGDRITVFIGTKVATMLTNITGDGGTATFTVPDIGE